MKGRFHAFQERQFKLRSSWNAVLKTYRNVSIGYIKIFPAELRRKPTQKI